jgi:hypothetical protein
MLIGSSMDRGDWPVNWQSLSKANVAVPPWYYPLISLIQRLRMEFLREKRDKSFK